MSASRSICISLLPKALPTTAGEITSIPFGSAARRLSSTAKRFFSSSPINEEARVRTLQAALDLPEELQFCNVQAPNVGVFALDSHGFVMQSERFDNISSFVCKGLQQTFAPASTDSVPPWTCQTSRTYLPTHPPRFMRVIVIADCC